MNRNENQFAKAIMDVYSTLEKAKKVPIGTISKGKQKVAEGKWVPVKKETTKQEPKEDKETKETKEEDKKKKFSPEQRETLKHAIKNVLSTIADAFSMHDTIPTAAQGTEQLGKDIKAKKNPAPEKGNHNENSGKK